jgi:hypothetical protein
MNEYMTSTYMEMFPIASVSKEINIKFNHDLSNIHVINYKVLTKYISDVSKYLNIYYNDTKTFTINYIVTKHLSWCAYCWKQDHMCSNHDYFNMVIHEFQTFVVCQNNILAITYCENVKLSKIKITGLEKKLLESESKVVLEEKLLESESKVVVLEEKLLESESKVVVLEEKLLKSESKIVVGLKKKLLESESKVTRLEEKLPKLRYNIKKIINVNKRKSDIIIEFVKRSKIHDDNIINIIDSLL